MHVNASPAGVREKSGGSGLSGTLVAGGGTSESPRSLSLKDGTSNGSHITSDGSWVTSSCNSELGRRGVAPTGWLNQGSLRGRSLPDSTHISERDPSL
ncbi:hypothetical protein CRG98_003065 [Punica granatum]|uniref:Uncharacterized protein n=1 Tax=Punica granatum TaxID=22663 RepID=A0A2I0L728_PUNGR|nr:hypothetical protein CRG98_003065 [Punica granatum]